MWAKVSIEVHRSTYGFTDPTQSHLKLEYSIGSRFVRTCIDTYPERTWMIKKISDHSLGCANAVLGADMMCLCWFANLLPIVFSMKPSHALLSNALVFALVAGALIICDTEQVQMFAVLFVQLMSGLSGALLSKMCYRLEMNRFLDSKSTAALAAKSRAMLHSFIPRSILPRLEGGAGAGMICAHIPDAVVMFCSVELPAGPPPAGGLPREAFRLLHALYCRFDDEVQRFGMFKYQVAGPLPPPPLPSSRLRSLRARDPAGAIAAAAVG